MLLASAKRLAAQKSWVYVLACKGNCIYVGFSRNLHDRLVSHFTGCGAVFTKLHKPLKVLELIEVKGEADEYKIWCLHAHRLGSGRVGGWNTYLAEQFNFEWEYPVKRTNRKYEPTRALSSDYQSHLTFGGTVRTPHSPAVSPVVSPPTVVSVKVRPTVLKRLKLVLNL